MSGQQFKVGDRVRWGTITYCTVLAVDGTCAWIKVDGGLRYTADIVDLRPIAKRYVVELRSPKEGEHYIFFVDTNRATKPYETPRFVIVDEVEQ